MWPPGCRASRTARASAPKRRSLSRLDLEELEARDATVSSSGVGMIDISATGKVDASLSGAGRIALHRKPTLLTSNVSGMGVIDQDY